MLSLHVCIAVKLLSSCSLVKLLALTSDVVVSPAEGIGGPFSFHATRKVEVSCQLKKSQLFVGWQGSSLPLLRHFQRFYPNLVCHTICNSNHRNGRGRKLVPGTDSTVQLYIWYMLYGCTRPPSDKGCCIQHKFE